MIPKFYCSLCGLLLLFKDIELIIHDAEVNDDYYYCADCSSEFYGMLDKELKDSKKIHLKR